MNQQPTANPVSASTNTLPKKDELTAKTEKLQLIGLIFEMQKKILRPYYPSPGNDSEYNDAVRRLFQSLYQNL